MDYIGFKRKKIEKRRMIKAGRKARFYRRLQNLTEWQLTEAGLSMLLHDDSDDDGGDYPRWNDYPIVSPTGTLIAETSY